MHLGVTVHAVPAKQKRARVGVGQAITILQLAGMERGGMALLTQERPASDQQTIVHGTVRTMTQAAIIGRRWVFEQERTSFLGMAGIAGIVQRRFDQRGFGG